MGSVRVLRQPHALLLGTAAAPGVHPARPPRRLRPDRRQSRRARDAPDLLTVESQLTAERPGQTLIGDKNYFGREFEQQLAELDIRLLRPARKGEAERPGSQLFKPLRQVIESINETFRASSTLDYTTAAPRMVGPSASCSASPPSPPPSGTTTTPASQSCAH